MDLKTRILDDTKAAMKAQAKDKLKALRLLAAAIKQKEVDERITLDDAAILAVIDKMLKQRRESIKQYGDAGRQDLVDAEQSEVTVLQLYLPTPLTDAEITAMIKQAIANTQATTKQDMGKVMAAIKPLAQGRADIAAISAKVKEHLG